jgi:hypothetical protein
MRPSMQRWPNHHADDMGAILGVPSSFSVVIRTTILPQYRIAGEIVVRILNDLSWQYLGYEYKLRYFCLNGRYLLLILELTGSCEQSILYFRATSEKESFDRYILMSQSVLI